MTQAPEQHLSQPLQDDPKQSKRFIDMAREVDADENPETFERAFDKIAKPTKPLAPRSRPSGKQPSS